MFRRIYTKWLVWRGKAVDIWSKCEYLLVWWKGNPLDRQSSDYYSFVSAAYLVISATAPGLYQDSI